MTISPTRLFYVDDSGSVDTGFVVYAWIETTMQGWRRALREWLDFRKELHSRHQIPATHELHATKFVPDARTRLSIPPSTDPSRLEAMP